MHKRGIEGALRSGADALVNLDVLVPNTIGGYPVLEGHWRGARRIEGQGSSSSRVVKTPVVTPVVVPPERTPVDPPVSEAESPIAVDAPTGPDVMTPALTAEELFKRAS